jgi:tRNA modification GTPase
VGPGYAAVDGDTIAAIATAPGRGGVALLRVSGPGALAVAGAVLRPTAGPWPPPARRATRAAAHDPPRSACSIVAW